MPSLYTLIQQDHRYIVEVGGGIRAYEVAGRPVLTRSTRCATGRTGRPSSRGPASLVTVSVFAGDLRATTTAQ